MGLETEVLDSSFKVINISFKICFKVINISFNISFKVIKISVKVKVIELSQKAKELSHLHKRKRWLPSEVAA